jgi:hypothetical protein
MNRDDARHAAGDHYQGMCPHFSCVHGMQKTCLVFISFLSRP